MEAPQISTSTTDEYFSSYEDLGVHRLMLEDRARTEAYLNAINETSFLFQDMVIMDVGAGTGILSLAAARAGAKKVYAVEASNLANALPGIAKDNGFENIIEVIHSRVEDVKIPAGSVDILISEWMGAFLLHESMLDSVLFARDAFLKRCGLMFPETCTLYGAAVSLSEYWISIEEFWKQQHYGFNFSKLLNFEGRKSLPHIILVPPESLVTDTQIIFKFKLTEVKREELKSISDRKFFSIQRDCFVHGVAVWFTVGFPIGDKEGKDLILSTAPSAEPTHWKQFVLLLQEQAYLEEGDIVGWRIDIDQSTLKPRQYQISLQMLRDEGEDHPIPCSCGKPACAIIQHYLEASQTPSDDNESDI